MEAKKVSLDIITIIPQTIIETILCLLPIQQAARTSILSREWRYKWTTIPKLKFSESNVSRRTIKKKQTNYIEYERKKMMHKLLRAIHQVLLLRQGPIHEFSLSMSADDSCFELDQILLHLSKNHPVKKLSLSLNNYYYKLPLCVSSLHQLIDLHLYYVDLDHQPTFSGFGSLRNLCLYDVDISTKALLHLLSNCPSLTSFSLFTDLGVIGREKCTVIELFECLPLIEDLTTYEHYILPMLVQEPIPKKLPTLLIHLKCFCLKDMYFDDDALRFLLVLIKCSPNLERLTLLISDSYAGYEYEICYGIFEEISDVWLEHLTMLEIYLFSNLKPEMEFVKFILARSPKLKKLSLINALETDEQLETLKILSGAPRASPLEIVVD